MSDTISTMGLLESSLNASRITQEVDANNIANANTPGYQTEQVDFGSMLGQLINPAPVPQAQLGASAIPISTQPGMPNLQPVIQQVGGTTVQNNGNNVDIDAQMTDLAANQLRYNALAQDITMRFTRMKDALTGV